MMQTYYISALLLGLLFADASLDASPEIIGPVNIKVNVHLGRPVVLDCEANPRYDIDMIMIYWLVNGSFPDELDISRISEMDESISSDGTVHRDLMLKNVTTEDLRCTYVCVVMNPEGVARKHVRLLTRFHSGKDSCTIRSTQRRKVKRITLV